MFLSLPLHTLYNPSEIIRSLSFAQKEGKTISVHPKGLVDQFQFAARLTEPLVPLHNFPERQALSNNNPSDYYLILADKKELLAIGKATEAIPYKDKWMVFSKVEY